MRKVVSALLFLVFWTSVLSLPASATLSREYEIKAAYVYQFGNFFDWSQKDQSQPFVIGILGQDPFGPLIDALRHEKMDGRPVQIERIDKIEQVKNPDILFISSSEQNYFPDLIQKLNGRGIVTVSDVESFAWQGGTISFVVRQNKIRFVVNKWNADKEGLKISSKLLRLAESVIEWPQ